MSVLTRLLVTAVAVVATATPAVAQTNPPRISVVNGASQPVFSLDDAINEAIRIDTGLDTDKDGVTDQVMAEILRPKEGQAGLKSPVVLHVSPYNEGYEDGNGVAAGFGDQGFTHDIKQD